MAQYTLTIKQIVEMGYNIFDFEYELFKEEYKSKFEKSFIDHFYFEEIAHETVGQFKHRLKSELNLILPKYNKIYETQLLEQRILDNYDVTEEFTREVESGATSTNRELYKDTPKTKIDIDKNDYVSSIVKNEGSSKGATIEKWTNNKKGNIGVQTDADAIVKYWESLRNVTLEIFDELEKLFIGLI